MGEKLLQKKIFFKVVLLLLLSAAILFSACSGNTDIWGEGTQSGGTQGEEAEGGGEQGAPGAEDEPNTEVPKDDPTKPEPEVTEYEFTERQSVITAPVDNRRIYGICFVPNTNTPMRTVILCHGFGGNIFSVYSQARYFASRGYACFLYDFCGGSMFSMSSGSFDEMTIDSETDDLNVILDYVSSVSFVDPENIYIYGYSLGAFVAVFVAAGRKEEVAGLILTAPAFSLADEAKIYYETGRYFIMAGETFIENAYSYYGKMNELLASCETKTLILHGNKDKLVNISYSEKAVETMPDAAMITIEGAGHNYDFDDVDFIKEKSVEFLNSFKS